MKAKQMQAKRGSAIRRSAFTLSVALKSILRGGLKNIIVPITSLVLLVFIGMFGYQIVSSQKQLDKLYDESHVLAYYASNSGKRIDTLSLTDDKLAPILESGFVESMYYTCIRYADIVGTVQTAAGDIVEDTWFTYIPVGQGFTFETFVDNIPSNQKVVFTSSIRMSPEFFFENELKITFLDGYDASMFEGDECVCALSTHQMSAGGYSLGDTIRIGVYTTAYSDFMLLYKDAKIVASYSRASGRDTIYMPIAQSRIGYTLRVERYYSNQKLFYIPPESIVDGQVSNYEYEGFNYNAVSFKLKDLKNLKEFKTFLIENGYSPLGKIGASRMWVVIEDTLLNESAISINRHISYMTILFIAVYVIAVGIGFVLSYLLTKSRRAELAMMRSMGAGVFRTFSAFFIEQALLCLVGCAVGVVILRLIYGCIEPMQWYSFLGYTGCYWAGAMLSILFMNKMNVIEILTAKD